MNEKKYIWVCVNGQNELMLKLTELSQKDNTSMSFTCLRLLSEYLGVKILKRNNLTRPLNKKLRKEYYPKKSPKNNKKDNCIDSLQGNSFKY